MARAGLQNCLHACNQPLTLSGTSVLATGVTDLTNLQPTGAFLCETDSGYIFRVKVFGVACTNVTHNPSLNDLTVRIDGTLRAIATSGDVNRWTHDALHVTGSLNAADGNDHSITCNY